MHKKDKIKIVYKAGLEKLLDMKAGYVLDSTNFKFDRFILDNVGINIYDAYYCERGNLKSNGLRVFCNKELNWVVKKYYKPIKLQVLSLLFVT